MERPRSHVKVESPVDPEPAAMGRLDDLYGVYRDAYDALVPLFHRLAEVATRYRGDSERFGNLSSPTSHLCSKRGHPVAM